MSKAQMVADLLGVSTSEAREFCHRVQRHFRGKHPPFEVIADALREDPRKTAAEVALIISPKLVYTPKPKSSPSKRSTDRQRRMRKRTRKSQKRSERLVFASDPAFVALVADLIPDEDRGDDHKARQFLKDLERRDSRCKRLTKDELLVAIRKASQRGSLNVDRVIVEIRKLRYGYRGDPDRVHVVHIPMGGKNP